MNKTAPLIAITAIAATLLASTAFSLGENNPDNARNRTPGQFAAAGGSGGQGVFGDAPPRNPFAGVRLMRYEIIDQRQGGLIAATVAVPEGWRAQSRLDWDFSSANNPTRRQLRIDAPDGGAWVQGYPTEVFTWISAPDQVATGSRSFGMIRYPNITMAQAMTRYVIEPHRGKKKNLRVLGTRIVPHLAQKFMGQNVPGESISVRVRFEENGQMVDEDFYAILTDKITIPYDGPQGRTYEYHRTLALVHSIGAKSGTLDNVYPLLGFIAASQQVNPMWEQHRQRTIAAITREWQRQLAAGYAQIAAAGRMSRAISANNDSMLASMATTRAQSNAAYAARRTASAQRTNSDFDGYIRGTEKMNDPYWGTSEHAYTDKYHWTDGQGSYQHSNEAGFNPNVGARINWTLMKAAQ